MGQIVDCGAGPTIDGGAQVPGRLLTGVPGPLKYYARFLPVPKVYASNTVRALSVLGHPNVIAPIGVGGVDGDVFIVQELPEGELLDRWVAKGRTTGERLKLREVEQVFRQVATALRHAHQAQIRHGSLGSSQVRVVRQSSGDLYALVVDFGMLPLLAGHATSLSVHEWHQLSPEQAAQPANASASSDLFSLGVLLIELLTGHPYVPPAGKMPWRELCLAKPGEVRATVARERPETPDAVLDLVASLVRARPEDRSPATAMDLSRVLPRLSWEARAIVSPADAPRGASRAESAQPDVARAATMAPSRSFVVSGASYARPVATSPVAAPPVAAPSPPVAAPLRDYPPSPQAAVARVDDDETLSEVPPDFAWVDPVPETAPASARSWFASEETVLTTQSPPDDETNRREALPADGTRIVPVPERPSATPPSPGRRGFFRTEGTAVLAHPDQLAAPRGEVSVWEGTRALEAPPPQPHPLVRVATMPLPSDALLTEHTEPVPVQAPAPTNAAAMPFTLVAIESTMPDTAMPDPLRAVVAALPPPRRQEPRAATMPPPRPLAVESDGAHPALLVLVVVAGGLVLGLVLWGFLHS